ncbi:MAG: hypothetical protein VX293_04050 [Candidatus Latescibacterota bacterium]|nr:hypothetical protein [Candidatus Latescibacterota bacterium]
MEIPDYFCAKAARTFGVEGEHWLRHLPEIIARCKDRWQLSICIPFHNLSINLVGTAQSAADGDVVLKIDGPHAERHPEILALQLRHLEHLLEL